MADVLGAINLALGAAKGAAPILLEAIPGKIERTEKKAIQADQQRLSGAAGGFSPGEYQARLAQSIGASQAAQRSAEEALARGGSSDVISGLQQQRAMDVARAGQAGVQQATAETNLADQQSAAQQRAELQGRIAAQIGRTTTRNQRLGGGQPGMPGVVGSSVDATQNALIQGATGAKKLGQSEQALGAGGVTKAGVP